MAIYAVDDDDIIYAGNAEKGKTYWCIDCFGPVKSRRGKSFLPHFYHLRASPSCRLYSKTEDHFLVQIQLQKQFPEGALQMERPFVEINRVADLCWEAEKIIFEIQCSPISEKEAELRIRDYKSRGYDVIWLLDDKRYNKRVLRPSEEFLRRNGTYYVSIKNGLTSKYYDQFEVFTNGKRVKRGRRMEVSLRNSRKRPKVHFSENSFPKQIIQLTCEKYFKGDRFDRALQNHTYTMHYWRDLEILNSNNYKVPVKWKLWVRRYITEPYTSLLLRLIKKVH